MQKKNLVTLLIGLVAVVVVLESIVLISSLGGGKQIVQMPFVAVKTSPVVTKSEVRGPAVFEVLFNSSSSSMRVGKSYSVSVEAMAKEARSLNALDVYVKYNPSVMDISSLTFDKKLPKPTFQKVSTLKGMLVANFLVTGSTPLKLNAGEVLSLMRFQVTPKKEGSYKLEISTGNEVKESVTMFTESATSKALPFSSNELNVNVTK